MRLIQDQDDYCLLDDHWCTLHAKLLSVHLYILPFMIRYHVRFKNMAPNRLNSNAWPGRGLYIVGIRMFYAFSIHDSRILDESGLLVEQGFHGRFNAFLGVFRNEETCMRCS